MILPIVGALAGGLLGGGGGGSPLGTSAGPSGASGAPMQGINLSGNQDAATWQASTQQFWNAVGGWSTQTPTTQSINRTPAGTTLANSLGTTLQGILAGPAGKWLIGLGLLAGSLLLLYLWMKPPRPRK